MVTSGSTRPVQRIDHLNVLVEKSCHRMEHPQKQNARFASLESFINPLGNKLIPAL
jgi:hypothetical protein